MNVQAKTCHSSCAFTVIPLQYSLNECKEYCTGIKLSGMRIEMLRFADDIAVIAQDEIKLKRTLECLDDILKGNYKTKINRKKKELWFASKILQILILKWMTTP
jgi:hypothetical protein